MIRPTNPDVRRRALHEIYRALPQEERDALDTASRREAERAVTERGVAAKGSEVWACEVSKLWLKIRDRKLTPPEWQAEDAADELRRSVEEAAAEKSTPKRSKHARKNAHRPARAGKDASIAERERDAG